MTSMSTNQSSWSDSGQILHRRRSFVRNLPSGEEIGETAALIRRLQSNSSGLK